MKKVLCLIILLVNSATAQQFTSPRANALGAYVAVSDDNFGLDWNTSGMAFGRYDFVVDFTDRNFEAYIRDVGLSIRLWQRHVLVARRTPLINILHGFSKFPRPQTPDDVVPLDLLTNLEHIQDRAFGYAVKITSRFSAGLDMKRHIFRNNLFSSSRFWSFSLSAAYRLSDRLQFGLVSRNMLNYHYREHFNRISFRTRPDSEFKVFEVDYEALPSVFIEPDWRLEFGVAFRPFDRLLLAVDVFSDGSFGAGMELEILKGIYLRQGWSRKSDGLFKPEKLRSYAFGLGVKLGRARFDMSWNPWVGYRNEVFTTFPEGRLKVGPLADRVFLLSSIFYVH